MQFSLRQIRYIVAAAESGNVTEAARRLHVSQPSISSAIADVESFVGTALFIRHHARGITLTPAGERLISEARQLLKHAHDFAQTAVALGGSIQGQIAVGCFLTFAVRFMPRLLAEFTQRHPGVTVNLHEGDQKEVVAMLLSGRTELALAYSSFLPDSVAAEPLAVLPPHVIVSIKHRLARCRSVSLRDFADEPFILLDLPYSRDYFLGLFDAVGVKPRIAFRSRSQELIRGLVAHGHGFAIQNAIPATTVCYDGHRIAVLRLKEKLTPARIMILHLKHTAIRPAVAAFVSYLRETFAIGGAFAPGTIAAPTRDD